VYETIMQEADLACGTKPFSKAQNAYKNKNIRELYKFKISRKNQPISTVDFRYGFIVEPIRN